MSLRSADPDDARRPVRDEARAVVEPGVAGWGSLFQVTPSSLPQVSCLAPPCGVPSAPTATYPRSVSATLVTAVTWTPMSPGSVGGRPGPTGSTVAVHLTPSTEDPAVGSVHSSGASWWRRRRGRSSRSTDRKGTDPRSEPRPRPPGAPSPGKPPRTRRPSSLHLGRHRRARPFKGARSSARSLAATLGVPVSLAMPTGTRVLVALPGAAGLSPCASSESRWPTATTLPPRRHAPDHLRLRRHPAAGDRRGGDDELPAQSGKRTAPGAPVGR